MITKKRLLWAGVPVAAALAVFVLCFSSRRSCAWTAGWTNLRLPVEEPGPVSSTRGTPSRPTAGGL